MQVLSMVKRLQQKFWYYTSIDMVLNQTFAWQLLGGFMLQIAM